MNTIEKYKIQEYFFLKILSEQPVSGHLSFKIIDLILFANFEDIILTKLSFLLSLIPDTIE